MQHSSMPVHLRELPSSIRRRLIEEFMRQSHACPASVRWSRAEHRVGVSVVAGDDEDGFPIRYVRVGNDLYRAA